MESAARIAQEEKSAQLAQELRAAEGKQVLAKLEADMSLLKSRIPDDRVQAERTAKDLKYLRERQANLGVSISASFYFAFLPRQRVFAKTKSSVFSPNANESGKAKSLWTSTRKNVSSSSRTVTAISTPWVTS